MITRRNLIVGASAAAVLGAVGAYSSLRRRCPLADQLFDFSKQIMPVAGIGDQVSQSELIKTAQRLLSGADSRTSAETLPKIIGRAIVEDGRRSDYVAVSGAEITKTEFLLMAIAAGIVKEDSIPSMCA